MHWRRIHTHVVLLMVRKKKQQQIHANKHWIPFNSKMTPCPRKYPMYVKAPQTNPYQCLKHIKRYTSSLLPKAGGGGHSYVFLHLLCCRQSLVQHCFGYRRDSHPLICSRSRHHQSPRLGWEQTGSISLQTLEGSCFSECYRDSYL